MVSGPANPTHEIGISSLAGLFLFNSVGEDELETTTSPDTLFRLLGGFCNRSSRSGKDGDEEDDDGEWFVFRALSGGDESDDL